MTAGRGPGRLFALLCALNLLNYIDRQVVTGLIEPIRAELGATDAQMGLVGSAFLLTYTFLPPIFGWLGDRAHRTRLMGISAAVWCLATAAAGLVRSVGQLALARGFVGIGEASYMANTPGVISDLYRAERRGRMLSIFYAAAPIGAAIGVSLAGIIAAHWGWRAACLIVGLPGLLAAVLLYRSTDPPRGAMDDAPAPPAPPLGVTLRLLAGNRAFVVLLLAFAGHIFVQNAVEYWLPTILQRDKAIPIAVANSSYGAMVFIAGVVGPLLGAWAGDRLRARTRHGYAIVAAAAIVGTIVPLAAIAVASDRAVVFSAVLLEALFGNAATGLVLAIAMEQVGAEMRATTSAVLVTSVHLLGDFISWPLVGALSTALTNGSFEWVRNAAAAFGATGSLSVALATVTAPVALLSGVLYLGSTRVTRGSAA
ncbi:MAG: MFS transporter [Gemmatimonadetes bacterium]|nr:MFS transporter [Gemmatimonadota bacterium]